MPAPDNIAILVAALGGHQVTMTNPKLGTVQVGRRGYNMFRVIVANRGVVAMEDTQSEVLCELSACFEAAKPLSGRDSNGNRMLLDKDTDLLFVIEDERRILIAVYDKRVKREKKKDAPKRQAA